MAFLNKLKVLLQIEKQADFARMCGKHPPNMANYLKAEPSTRVLQDCLLNATISRIFKNPPDDNTTFGQDVQKIRDDVLSSTISNLFGQEIQSLKEIEPIPKNRNRLPESGGVYILYDSAATVLYIGQAKSFRAEVWQTLDGGDIPVGMRFGPDMRKSKPVIRKLASYMSLYRIDSADLRHNIEALLIRVFINQTHNSNIAKFKKSRQVRHR